MHFGLTDTQDAIKSSAREFFSAECPLLDVRRLAETDTAYDAALWAKCAEQGWTGMIFPEAYDGVGLGFVDMAAAWEEMGRALAPGPFISTVLLAGTILDRAGSDEHKRQYLRPICQGNTRATLALLETGVSWDPSAVRMNVERDGAGAVRLTGEKLFVSDAAIADVLLVVARLDRELVILIVPRDAPGVSVTLMPAIDLTRRVYRVAFAEVAVPAANLLARGDVAHSAIAAALDVACIGLVAEMVGGMQRLVELTTDYAKTREQFGRQIGAFQAVQHQLVDMLALVEGTRSAVYYAAWALSEQQPDARVAVSVAKAYASEAYREVGNRAIQIHGGMGFTWENDCHLYYRRAKSAEVMLGDATDHRERIARSLLPSP